MSIVDVVFMGSEDFSLPILQSLLADEAEVNVRVVGIVTQPDRAAGRGRKVALNPVKAQAVERGLPILQPERLRDDDSISAILRLEPHLIVVASYGQIVPRVLLDTPVYRCLNLHPSLLPRYRGASPVTAPILAGDSETGATLMLMRPRMDAGPLLAQETVPIGSTESAAELEARLATVSAHLLSCNLGPWVRGEIEPVEQDDRLATYTSRLAKSDGVIDWTLTAEQIERRVRAFNPWPTAFTFWRGGMVKILGARAVPGHREPGQVEVLEDAVMTVGTGQGLLQVERLQLAGGKVLAPSDVVRGHRDLARTRFEGAD